MITKILIEILKRNKVLPFYFFNFLLKVVDKTKYLLYYITIKK